MSYLDHDGLAYFKSKLDRTFIADIVFDDGDILLYGGDGTLLKTVVQEGTVTQKKSTTNKEYPILLCWDADAEEDQTMKTVWYGLDARINPKFGYLYARRYYTEHPSYERTSVPSTRAEWHHMFTDAVSAPMGEVYEYLDRNSDGGEHRMELRLYGNPLSQYVDTPNHNEATDAVSIGVGATRGDTLTFFGYCPSTPIYLENGTTMRKSTVRGDQYGKDIITRDWLNLNGSITGLVHTYMDETIDGYKTFLKTVTIDSGNDNAKAGLNVQGDVNIDSGDNTKPSNLYVQGNSHIHGNEDIDGNLNVDGTSTLDGNVHMKHNLDVDGNLNVDGTSDQHGNVHMYNNLTVDKNATVGGKLTAEDLEATDDLTVGDDATIGGDLNVPNGTTTTKVLHVTDDATVDDNLNVGGTINKVSGGSTTEYVQYITNQPNNREAIAANLIDTSKGLQLYSGKIGVKPGNGITVNSNGVNIDFAALKQNNESEFNKLIESFVDAQRISTSDGKNQFYVDGTNGSNTNPETRGTPAAPFQTIQACVNYITKIYNFHSASVFINCKNINVTSNLTLPNYNRTTATITIRAANFTASTARDNPTVDLTTTNLKITYTPAATNASRFGISVIGTGEWKLRNFDVVISDASMTSSGGHLAALSVGGNATANLQYCKFTTNRTVGHPEYADNTTGEHVVYGRDYGHIDIGAHVEIVGGDYASSDRTINGFYIVGNSSMQIDDTRSDSGPLVFTGKFANLIACTSKVTRNQAYRGVTDTSGVTKADYRFYIYAGGSVDIREDGVIDATHNNENATDTWLGSITGSKSYVSTKSYSWYD